MGLAVEVEQDVADSDESRLILRYLTLMEEGRSRAGSGLAG